MTNRNSRLAAATGAAVKPVEPATPPAAAPITETLPPAAGETDAEPADEPVPGVAVRVLRAAGGHKPDDVVDLDQDELEAAVMDGWADPDPAAVAYARSLRG